MQKNINNPGNYFPQCTISKIGSAFCFIYSKPFTNSFHCSGIQDNRERLMSEEATQMSEFSHFWVADEKDDQERVRSNSH